MKLFTEAAGSLCIFDKEGPVVVRSSATVCLEGAKLDHAVVDARCWQIRSPQPKKSLTPPEWCMMQLFLPLEKRSKR